MTLPPDIVALLDRTAEVQMETTSPKGVRHEVPIWVVVDGGDVFARSYIGESPRWYREILARPGALVAGSTRIPVKAVPATDGDSIRRTSEGFRKKYPTSPSLRAMQRPEVLGTTVRFEAPD
jgi:hypothetical protein